MPDFEECFWGEEGNGFEVLAAKFKRSSAALKDLITYFRERASIEERYAKDLQRLNVNFHLRGDEGTVQQAQNACTQSTDVFYKLHNEMATKLIGEVVQPLETLRGNLKSEFRLTEENYHKAVKNLSKETNNVERMRLVYVAKSKERDKAEVSSQGDAGLSKDLKKSREKFMKLDKEANVSVMDYRRSITEWEKTRDRWVEEMKSAAKTVQNIEEQRILYIRSVLLSILNWQRREATETRKKSLDHFHEALENINPSKDIQSFISLYQTGSIDRLPPVPVFKHYLSPEKSASEQLYASMSRSASQASVVAEDLSLDRHHLNLNGGDEEEPKVCLSSGSLADGETHLSRETSSRSSDSQTSEAVPKKSKTTPPQKNSPDPKELIAASEKIEAEKGPLKKTLFKGLDTLTRRGSKEAIDQKDNPKNTSNDPGKTRLDQRTKSLPFLSLEQPDHDARGRSGTFTMVNPLAAQRIIPPQNDDADRYEIFRALIQRKSVGHLQVSPNEDRGSKTVRESVWIEGWVRSKENAGEWKDYWGTVEGGCLWFFEKPEDNLEPPGMNNPQSKLSLRGCTVTVQESANPENEEKPILVIEYPKRPLKLLLQTDKESHPLWLSAIEAFMNF